VGWWFGGRSTPEGWREARAASRATLHIVRPVALWHIEGQRASQCEKWHGCCQGAGGGRPNKLSNSLRIAYNAPRGPFPFLPNHRLGRKGRSPHPGALLTRLVVGDPRQVERAGLRPQGLGEIPQALPQGLSPQRSSRRRADAPKLSPGRHVPSGLRRARGADQGQPAHEHHRHRGPGAQPGRGQSFPGEGHRQ